MPYKDAQKQREANKERMRRVRQGNTIKSVLPVLPVLPKVAALQEMIHTLEQKVEKPCGDAQGVRPPIYDFRIHKPGDRVRMFDGQRMVELVVPDADGHPFEAASHSYTMASHQDFMPSYKPIPKPAKKVKVRRW